MYPLSIAVSTPADVSGKNCFFITFITMLLASATPVNANKTNIIVNKFLYVNPLFSSSFFNFFFI